MYSQNLNCTVQNSMYLSEGCRGWCYHAVHDISVNDLLENKTF